MNTWTHERIQFLKTRYGTMPNSEIASTLGLTINAVIGKAHRLGLCRTLTPYMHKDAVNYAIMPAKRVRSKKMAKLPQKKNNSSMADLKPNECRYPYGDENYTFCRKPTKGTYCDKHYADCHLVSKK